jgi:hypothetical protein
MLMRTPIKFEELDRTREDIIRTLKLPRGNGEYRTGMLRLLSRLDRFWSKAETDPVRYARFWQRPDKNRWGPSASEEWRGLNLDDCCD